MEDNLNIMNKNTCMIYKNKKQNEIQNFDNNIWVSISRDKTLEKNWYSLIQLFSDTYVIEYYKNNANKLLETYVISKTDCKTKQITCFDFYISCYYFGIHLFTLYVSKYNILQKITNIGITTKISFINHMYNIYLELCDTIKDGDTITEIKRINITRKINNSILPTIYENS